FGLTRKDVKRMTYVAVDAEKEMMWLIVQTTKDYDKDKILSAAKDMGSKFKEKEYEGKQYYVDERDKDALYFPSKRVLVFAPSVKAMQKCLALPKKPASGPLDDALEKASKSRNHFVAGTNIPPELMDKARANIPPQMGQVRSLLDARTAYVTASIK